MLGECLLSTDASAILLEQLTSKYSEYPAEVFPYESSYVEPTAQQKQLLLEKEFFSTLDKYLFELAWTQMDRDLDQDFSEFESELRKNNGN